jgi:hypothetical protein
MSPIDSNPELILMLSAFILFIGGYKKGSEGAVSGAVRWLKGGVFMDKQQKAIPGFGFVWLLVMLLALALSGCASVPKESVELSKEVGKGIAESQRSYSGLLNTYFAAKKQQVDQWIENEYLPDYLSNIQAELKKAGQPTTLTAQQLKDVLHDVIIERDQKQADLENTRLLLLMKSNDHYALLSQGNAGVTALLQSMVNVNEATSAATQTIKTTSGGKVDLDQIENKFNDYLKKAGAASVKATNLYDTVKSMFEKKGE